MSVGLLVKGRIKRGIVARLKAPSPKERLERIGKWFRECCSDLVPDTLVVEVEGGPSLYVSLHPAAEDVDITLDADGHCIVSANTSSAGPGYHIFLCDALHRMGKELEVTWLPPSEDYLDETGYFESGQPAGVHTAMTEWVQTVAAMVVRESFNLDTPTRLAMPMNESFEADERAVTAIGPRSLDWLQRASSDEEVSRDFFAWREPALDADYFLRRALTRMWCDVRWRPPCNDTEKQHLTEVADCLERAYKLDPSLDYPWTEWLEVLDVLERRDEHGIGGRALAKATVGYRRRNVKVQLPGDWWIQIPGRFSDFLDDGDASYAVDPPREIWFTGYRFTEPGDEALASWKKEANLRDRELAIDRDGYSAWASIEESQTAEGTRYFALKSSNTCREGRCVCTIIFEEPDERSWAIDTWRSLPQGNE